VQRLVALYTSHIEKEDKKFFLPAMKYFTKKEQDEMIAQFADFDKNVVQAQYKEKIQCLERRL